MATTVWKGQLTFGLVSVPVRIIRAGRQARVQFRKVYRTSRREEPAPAEEEVEQAPAVAPVRAAASASVAMPAPVETYSAVAPVRHEYATQGGDQKLDDREVLRGVEYSKGEFAVFRPEELKRFREETSSDMEILQFVKTEAIDPVYLNASYYVLPDKGADKPYALLYEAMKKSRHAAMAYVAMHGRKQLLMLRAGEHGIVMHTMFFENEAHRAEEFHADTKVVTPQEMKLAEMLISQLEAEFDPSQFSDERLEKMRAAVQAKIGGRQTAEAAPASAPKPVVDIMEALKKSLAAKKPAARAATAPARHSRAG